MSYPDRADFLIDAYKGRDILIGTWHVGEASRDMEIEVFKTRMARGEVDHIYVFDVKHPEKNYILYPDGTKRVLR